MTNEQLELFGQASTGPGTGMVEPPPPEFVERIRSELLATLALAREATYLPWANLTKATLAELRFKSIADWLPQPEADSLRDAFEAELVRIYDNEDARYDRENAETPVEQAG